MTKVQVVYFAWLRERIGVPSQEIHTNAKTVSQLIVELRLIEPRYEMAFTDTSAVRVAIDQELTDFSASLSDGQEIAFFPPMTGG